MYGRYDIAVIGGGASGMMAAITAAQSNPGLKIAVLEKNPRVGKKLLSTGNGRCNLTNLNQDSIHYHGKNVWFIKEILQQFDLNDTLSFFKTIGIETISENGKVFPRSLQATSVLDLLRFRMQLLKIEEICEFCCCKVKKEKDSFSITSQDGQRITSTSVLIATGGKASPQLGSSGDGYQILEQFGHHLTPLHPALVQVCVPSKKTLPLKGIKVQATVSVLDSGVVLGSDRGEVLFTEYGLSGPPIFQLSRFVSSKSETVFSLDLFPEQDFEGLCKLLTERSEKLPKDKMLTGLLHNTVGRELLRELRGTPQDMKSLIQLLKNWKFSVKGTRGWSQAQITCGGAELSEFSPLTLESKKVKGLFACGEILDADGDCGGYNLQWAWSSGVVAGRALSKR